MYGQAIARSKEPTSGLGSYWTMEVGMATGVQELKGLVDTAKQATAGLESSELRRVAFERVLEYLLTNGTEDTPVRERGDTPKPASSQTDFQSADGAFAEEQQRIDAIASYFRITPEEVLDIFDPTADEPALNLPTAYLSDTKTAATREISLLIAGARTALGQETSTSHIRSEADNYGKLDSKHFMGVLRDMPEIHLLGKRGSRNRVIRMKVPGAEKAQELAQRLVGA